MSEYKVYTVDEKFIREAHTEACDAWRAKLEKKFPGVINTVFEAGQWYKDTRKIGETPYERLVFILNPEVNKNGYFEESFGFDCSGIWHGKGKVFSQGYLMPADSQDVLKSFVKMVKKVGYNEKNFSGLIDSVGFSKSYNFTFENSQNGGVLYTMPKAQGGKVVYAGGEWAEKKKTMSRKAAERELNVIIED